MTLAFDLNIQPWLDKGAFIEVFLLSGRGSWSQVYDWYQVALLGLFRGP